MKKLTKCLKSKAMLRIAMFTTLFVLLDTFIEMNKKTEEQVTYSITLESLLQAQNETNGEAVGVGGGGADGETGGGGTGGGGETGGQSGASDPSCVGGGCGALSCSISLKTDGGYTVSSGGATVGSSGGSSGALSCQTYEGSGYYCCCTYSYEEGSWWNPLDNGKATITAVTKSNTNCD